LEVIQNAGLSCRDFLAFAINTLDILSFGREELVSSEKRSRGLPLETIGLAA